MERFIRRYSFSPSDCDALVAWFEDNPDFHTTAVISNNSGSNIVDYRVKDATCINLNLEDAYGINTNFSSFLDFLWESVNSYVAEFIELSYMNFSMLEAFQISRYTPPDGGFRADHCERNDTESAPRLLVWMLYLTDNGLEGGTNFKYLEHSETAEKGKLLIWPPDFTHTHNGIVDTEKYKYIITGWYNLASF
jgi:RNAse (barnase) inhibitor barstar|tara:strand:- start:902 stop:1480 length:579 start_codon:yes stop_codon:yes gene_type:complete